MRNKKRIKPFLEELGKIWEEECPDWRFGQLMYNVFSKTGDPFYFEEDKMLKEIKKYFKKDTCGLEVELPLKTFKAAGWEIAVKQGKEMIDITDALIEMGEINEK